MDKVRRVHEDQLQRMLRFECSRREQEKLIAERWRQINREERQLAGNLEKIAAAEEVEICAIQRAAKARKKREKA